MTSLTILPDYRALLQKSDLATFDALFAAGEANCVDGHWRRSVSRLELRDDDGRTVVIYLKRQWGQTARRPWREALRLVWPTWLAKREWNNATKLLAAGIPVAEPVAFGMTSDGDGPRALLAFRAVNGPSLARFVHDLPQGSEKGPGGRLRRTVAMAVGAAVRRLHDAGYSLPDLYAKHILLEGAADGAPRVVFIDAQRLRRHTRPRASADLAALYDTTRLPGVRRTDRLRFLRSYLGVKRFGPEARRLIRRIERRARRIAGRGRDPNLLETHRVAPPGMAPLAEEKMTVADGGRLRVNEAFLPALKAAGLATLDAIMAFEGGEVYRVGPGRSTVRVELPDPRGGARAIFIKRYTRVPLKTKIRRTISLGEPISAAKRELRSIIHLYNARIATMRCVAIGEEFTQGGRRERSCILTEEVPGAAQADDYAEAAFGEDRSAETSATKRRLIRAIARLVRRFHEAGFVHRDFYLCHILVRPVEGGEPILHLIDVQRIQRRRKGARRRWIVKDLAALLFSSWVSPATGIRSPVFTQTERMRFAREYFGTRRLSRRHKKLIRRIIRKAGRIARHDARRRARTGTIA